MSYNSIQPLRHCTVLTEPDSELDLYVIRYLNSSMSTISSEQQDLTTLLSRDERAELVVLLGTLFSVRRPW